ncbi:MIF4G domain-containing protein, partial [Toxoplasma gondii GAB2-2007-GAL-DOM2]
MPSNVPATERPPASRELSSSPPSSSSSSSSSSPSSSSSSSASPSPSFVEDSWRRHLEDAKEVAWRRRVRLRVLGGGPDGTEAVPKKGEGRENSIARLQKAVNRVKKITETDKEAILSELSRLNVSLFLSEITDSICELDFKLADVRAVVEVCAALHGTYPSFSSLLQQSLEKQIRATVESASAFVSAASSLPASSSHAASSSPPSFASLSPNLVVILPQDLSGKHTALTQRLRLLTRLVAELFLTSLLKEASLLPLLQFLTSPYAASAVPPGAGLSVSRVSSSTSLALASSLSFLLSRFAVLSSLSRKAASQLFAASGEKTRFFQSLLETLQNARDADDASDAQQQKPRREGHGMDKQDGQTEREIENQTEQEAEKETARGPSEVDAEQGENVEKHPEDLGRALRELMKELGVTEEDLAAAAFDEEEECFMETRKKTSVLLRHFYLSSASLGANDLHQQLIMQEQHNMQMVVNRGQVDAEANSQFLQLRGRLNTFLLHAQAIADAIQESPVDMQ